MKAFTVGLVFMGAMLLPLVLLPAPFNLFYAGGVFGIQMGNWAHTFGKWFVRHFWS